MDTRWRRLLQAAMDRRPTKRVAVAGEALFDRAFVFKVGPWVAYLHHYFRSDPDVRGLHDHPVRAFSLILAGGYDEERVLGLNHLGMVTRWKRFRPGSVNRLDQWCFHRLILEPARFVNGVGWVGGHTSWSLFFVRYVDKDWGFLKADPAQRMVPRDLSRPRSFTYTRAGDGIDQATPWWKDAPNGAQIREAEGEGTRRAERGGRPAQREPEALGDGTPGPAGEGGG